MMALKHRPSHLPGEKNQALKQMVDRLVSVGCGGVREPIGTDQGGDAALRAILLEIDETMLPRQITVVSEANRPLTLLASNRRLLTVHSDGTKPMPTPGTPQDLAQHFADAARDFVMEAKTIRLLAPQKKVLASEVGVSVSTGLLAQVLGVRDPAKSGSSPDGFDALRRASIASLHATPDLSFSEERGPDDHIDRLKTMWREYVELTASQSQNWAAQDAKRECYALGVERGTYLVLARQGHASWLVALLPREHLNALEDLSAEPTG